MDTVKAYEKTWDIRRQKFTCQGCCATFDEDGELLDGSICVNGSNSKMCPRPTTKRPLDAPSRNFDQEMPEDILYESPEEAIEGIKEMIGRAEPDPSCYEAVTPGIEVYKTGRDPVTGETKADFDALVEKDEYYVLRQIMIDAFNFASKGKGDERHGGPGIRWENQRHAAISKEVGTGFALGQAVKKTYESQRLDDGAAERELLGAMTYMASAIYAIRQGWRK